MQKTETAVIVGFGTGSNFSLSLARALLRATYPVAIIVRSETRAEQIRSDFDDEPNVRTYVAKLDDPANVAATVDAIERDVSPIGVYVHNAARLVTGKFLESDFDAYQDAWQAAVGTAIVVSQAILPRFAQRGRGVAIFSGATASIRGAAGFGPFAAAKFALRGLAQSLARELAPAGIHIAHVVIDGVIWGDRAEHQFRMDRAACIEPDALADLYLKLIDQPASCWTHEIDVRPAGEKF